MFTLLEMTNRVSNKVQKSSAIFQSHIKEWIDEKYDEIWKKKLWKASIRAKESGVSLVSADAFLILPKDVSEIIVIAERSDNKVLFQVDVKTLWVNFVDVIDNAGKPINYIPAGTVGFKGQPTSAETINVVSSAAGDTTQVVRLWFLVNGEEVTETVTLNGTTAVTSSNTCDASGFLRASKDSNTTGVITIEGNTSGTDFLVLAPEEFTAYHERIRLRHVPNAADTVSIYYKKRRIRFVNDQDIPEFDCSTALISGALAEAWKEQKQYSKSQLEEGRFNRLIADLIGEKEMQGENMEQAIPHIEQRGLLI